MVSLHLHFVLSELIDHFIFVILSTFGIILSLLCVHTTISEHIEDIIGLVFKYLHLIKEDGVHEWIFDEVIDRHIIYIIM